MIVKLITPKRGMEIVEDWSIEGTFIMYDKKMKRYVAIDNSTGQCYVEDFRLLDEAYLYLLGYSVEEIETGELIKY